jgi:hypothetical protein
MERSNQNYMMATDALRKCKNTLREISQQISDARGAGADDPLKNFLPQIVHQNYRSEHYERHSLKMKSNVERYAQFLSFLEKLSGDIWYVELEDFCSQVIKPAWPVTKLFERREGMLLSRIAKVAKAPKESCDPMTAFLAPTHRTGQILHRFTSQIQNIAYPDLDVIADALLDACRSRQTFSKDEIIDLLFENGWVVQNYPFAPDFPQFTIPGASAGIIPKVFNPPFLVGDGVYFSFDQLCCRNWPLRAAVDLILPMMFMTNPFRIARQFYNVIQEIGKCVQLILIRRNKDTKFVEIDFDQMFVLMILVLLASGISEITLPMAWAATFREFAASDPHSQYAMSHMEGLCVHLAKMDYQDLRRKSLQIQRQQPVDAVDPLGILVA